MPQPPHREPIELPWTGERFIPGHGGEVIELEHFHRYALAQQHCGGKSVLDLGCGSGYGTTMLREGGAAVVLGIDIALDAASFVARQDPDVLIAVASADSLPFPDGSFDLVVSFEVIEHIENPEGLVAESKRVLAASGAFIVSTPNKNVYNESLAEPNPFHVSEMELEEFRSLLLRHFRHVQFVAQKAVLTSIVWALEDNSPSAAIVNGAPPPPPPYLIAVCSDAEVTRIETSALTFWSDAVERDSNARAHILHLEKALAELAAALTESDEREARARDQLARDEAEIARLQDSLRRAGDR